MTGNESKIVNRARRAYEFARLRASLPVLVFVLPLIFFSLCFCEKPMSSACYGTALILASVGFLWRGQGYGKGVFRGLVIGLAAVVLPAFLRLAGYCCKDTIETLICLGSGLAAGGVVAWFASRSKAASRQQLVSSGLVAVLAGALGCTALGAAAAFGLVAGVIVTAPPVFVLLRKSHA